MLQSRCLNVCSFLRDAWDVRLVGPIKKNGKYFPNSTRIFTTGPSFRCAHVASAEPFGDEHKEDEVLNETDEDEFLDDIDHSLLVTSSESENENSTSDDDEDQAEEKKAEATNGEEQKGEEKKGGKKKKQKKRKTRAATWLETLHAKNSKVPHPTYLITYTHMYLSIHHCTLISYLHH
jgi:hypothetical protein